MIHASSVGSRRLGWDVDDPSTNIHITKLESLIGLARVLGRQCDFEEVLRLVVEMASVLVQSDSALIMMINPQTRHTIKTVYAGTTTDEAHKHFVHTNIVGWVALHNSSFISPDIQSDTRFRKKIFHNVKAKAALCVPFRVENVMIGTLLLLNDDKKPSFTEQDMSLVENVAAIASPFLHRTADIARYFLAPLPKQSLLQKYSALGLLGKSEKFVGLLAAIEAAARCDVRVLLEGESGTGKELVARSIHRLGARSGYPFVAVDCGAIQPNLVESELFGHVKGAFTGALADRKGLLEEAQDGTVFIDEINNLPLEMQSKLLRVLQDQEIRPVGSNQTRKLNVRIVAASSLSLRKLVTESKFREDLYYRLNVYPISVPPLDERVEDIPLLANHFIKKYSSEHGKQIDGVHEEVLDFLRTRHWSGNVRELSNLMERLVTLAGDTKRIIDRTILPPELQKEFKKQKKIQRDAPLTKSLQESLAECEEELIRRTLESCEWNQSRAARSLRISEHALRYKMAKLGISKLA